MKAPTNVYGPDGSLCKSGEEIPSEWFTILPDLQQHLDLLSPAAAGSSAEGAVTVAATAKLQRRRSPGSGAVAEEKP